MATDQEPTQHRSGGHTVGTGTRQGRVVRTESRPSQDRQSGEVRLLGLHEAARWLGVSYWTVRQLVTNGVVPRVRLPLGANAETRRVLVDLSDLQRLVESSKAP